MKIIARIGIFGVMIGLMVGAATASSLGTFTSETDVKATDGSATYSLTIFNIGQQDLEVTLQPANAEDVSVAIGSSQIGLNYGSDGSASFNMEASPPTESPGSEGSWFYLGDGEYIRTYKFTVQASLLESSYESFDINIRAKSAQKGERQNLSQVVQVRTYSYTIRDGNVDRRSEEEQEDPDVGFDFDQGNDGGFSGIPGLGLQDGSQVGSGSRSDSDGDPQVTIGDDNTSGQGDDPGTEIGDINNSESSSSQSSSDNSLTGSFFQSQNINGFTVILIIGVMASAVYLYRVI